MVNTRLGDAKHWRSQLKPKLRSIMPSGGAYTGALPFAWRGDASGRERWFLLGLENAERSYPRSHNLWSEFGGTAHSSDWIQSTAEETYEETMGALGTTDTIAASLRQTARPFLLPAGRGVEFLRPVEFSEAQVEMFNRMWEYAATCAFDSDGKLKVRGCREGWFEKKAMRWVSESQLRRALRERAQSHAAAAAKGIPDTTTPQPKPERDRNALAVTRSGGGSGRTTDQKVSGIEGGSLPSNEINDTKVAAGEERAGDASDYRIYRDCFLNSCALIFETLDDEARPAVTKTKEQTHQT